MEQPNTILTGDLNYVKLKNSFSVTRIYQNGESNPDYIESENVEATK